MLNNVLTLSNEDMMSVNKITKQLATIIGNSVHQTIQNLCYVLLEGCDEELLRAPYFLGRGAFVELAAVD